MSEIKANEIAEKNLLNGFIKDVKKGEDAIDDFNDSLKETLKIQDKIQKQAKKDTTSKGLKAQAKNLKKVDSTIKTLSDTQKVSLQLARDREKAELKLKKLNSDKIQSTVQLNRLSKEQNAINKDAEIINNKSVGTLEKKRAINRQLIREQSKLNLETKKGRDRLKVINKELDKNTAFIKKNSSAMQKQSQNVGNYTDSIKEAAGASGLFGGILGKLSAVQGTLAALTKKSVIAEEADVIAKEQQAAATVQLTFAQRALNSAQTKGIKALKLFRAALIGTGIGALIVALGALFTFFTRSQDGADALSDQMARLTATFDVLIDRMSLVGRGLVQIFRGLGDEVKQAQIKFKIFLLEVAQFKAFGETFNDNTEAIKKLNAELDSLVGIEKGLETIRSAFRGIGDEIARDSAAAKILNALTREATREAALFEAQQASTLTTVKELNLISRNKLNTDNERIAALTKANALEVELAEKQIDIQDKLLASALDALDVNTGSLKIDAARADFVERIKNGQIGSAEAVQKAADFTLSSAAGEQALLDIIEKIKDQEAAKQSLLDKQATTIKKLSALQVQVATKNAMALVREAQALREIAKNQEESIERRVELLTEAAVKEIESFRIQAAANIKNAQEVAAAKLQIETKLAAAIKKLLPDFEAIARKQVQIVNKIEQELLQNDIDRLQRRLEVEELSAKEIEKILDEIFETRKTKAQAQAEFLLSNEELTAEERELINIKLAKSLEDIENDRVDAVVNANNKILESDKELQAQREALADARINTAKNVADILSTLAGDDEARQKQIQDLQKALAVSEILINLRREVSGIREGNAGKDNAIVLNRAQTLQARTAALAGVAQVLSAYDGVDDTGGRGDVDSKGGKLWTLHPNEQVTSLKDRQAMADPITGRLRTRDEIKERVNFADNLMMSPHAFKQMEVGQIVQPKSVDLSRVVQGLSNQTKELKEAFKDGQVTYDVHWNSHGEAVEREKRKGLITRRTHKRSRL